MADTVRGGYQHLQVVEGAGIVKEVVARLAVTKGRVLGQEAGSAKPVELLHG